MAEANDNLITNEVLHCLQQLLKELGIRNHTIEISPGSIRGDNYLGIVAKAQVTGQDETNKTIVARFIIKSAPRNEKFRSIAPVRLAFQREAYMYSAVLPQFLAFQKEKHVSNPFDSIAKFYKSTMEDMNEAIIMEDMKQYNFDLYDRKKPLDYNHVLMVMKEYGKFHAISFALHDQKPKIFEQLSNNTPETFFSEMKGGEFLISVQKQSAQALNALDQIKDRVAYEKFLAFQENMKQLVPDVLKPGAAGKYAVIGHGDCWVNNMLFKYADPEQPHIPTEMCLLDWQLSRTGSPALDLSYFIFTCTDKELRNKHYEKLLKEYYKSFCTNLHELGSDPRILFPYEVLQEHLKKFSVYGLFMTIIVLFMMTSEADEIPDIHNVSDGDDVTELLKYESKNIDKYNARIRDVIVDYVNFGYEL